MTGGAFLFEDFLPSLPGSWPLRLVELSMGIYASYLFRGRLLEIAIFGPGG